MIRQSKQCPFGISSDRPHTYSYTVMRDIAPDGATRSRPLVPSHPQSPVGVPRRALDAGLLAALRNLSPDRLRRDRTPFGPLLETFVFGELLKLARWSSDRYTFSHFRDKERNEVDIVIEAGDGRIVGIEVKASADGLGQGLLRPETARRRVRGSLRARHGAVRP